VVLTLNCASASCAKCKHMVLLCCVDEHGYCQCLLSVSLVMLIRMLYILICTADANKHYVYVICAACRLLQEASGDKEVLKKAIKDFEVT
jgi:hypothetical protein